MALFNKNTPNQTNHNAVSNESQAAEQKLDFNQVEANIHQLAEKIRIEKEKVAHLLQIQRGQLVTLQNELKSLEDLRNGTMAHINSGGVKDSESLREMGKAAEEYNGKILEKQGKISKIELDIMLLEQARDEKSIQALLQGWATYEKGIFENHISPLYRETVAAKELYFEKLKQLRQHYSEVERLAIHLNNILSDGDKVTVHTWFGASQNSPELLITKHDEQREEAITHTYLAE